MDVDSAKDLMRLPERLDMPLKRLAAALDHLEAAAERRAESDARRADLEEELAVMQDDRARLGMELETSTARIRKLADANSEVASRLAAASASIRAMLGVEDDEPSSEAALPDEEA
jgi:septal ring factor EnvC (AmiA/AmiB activator)